MNTINFTEEKLTALIDLYNQAVKEGKESFLFEGQEVLISYAKYLIEYLKGELK